MLDNLGYQEDSIFSRIYEIGLKWISVSQLRSLAYRLQDGLMWYCLDGQGGEFLSRRIQSAERLRAPVISASLCGGEKLVLCL